MTGSARLAANARPATPHPPPRPPLPTPPPRVPPLRQTVGECAEWCWANGFEFKFSEPDLAEEPRVELGRDGQFAPGDTPAEALAKYRELYEVTHD